MKKDWEMKKLGEICDITTGSSDTIDAVENGQYAFFDRSKIVKKSSRYLFDAEALIIPGEGQQFFPKYYSGKFDLHQRAYALLNFHKDVDIKFVEYFLIFEHKYFERVAVGATVKSLRRRHFEDLEIPIMPLAEQKRIISVLDKLFSDIKKSKANTEQNLKNSKELFESYLQDIFRNKGKNWEEKQLGEEIRIINGRGQKDVLSATGKYPIMGSAGNVMGYASDYICEAETTIIGRKGNISKPIFINEKFWNVDTAFGLYPKNKLPKKLVYYICLNIDFAKMNRGTTIPSLVKTELLEIPISIPKSSEEQEAIVKELDKLNYETKKMEDIYKKKITELEELKKSILQKAFNGEL